MVDKNIKIICGYRGDVYGHNTWKENGIQDKMIRDINFYAKRSAPELAGKIYTVEQFRKNAWFYCPGTSKTYTSRHYYYEELQYPVQNPGSQQHRGSYALDVDEHVIAEHVEAIYEPTTDDSTVSSLSGYVGYIDVQIEHDNNRKSSYKINVYRETRNCSKDYRP